ncbi:MAG: PEP-CTERM sorting domain-containing protein [Phycisphaeraceae bacterium]
MSYVHRSRSARLAQVGGVATLALLALAATPARAELSSYAYFESYQQDLVMVTDQFIYEDRTEGESELINGEGSAAAVGEYHTLHQTHEYGTLASGLVNLTNRPVAMWAFQEHDFEMRGTSEESLWTRSDALIYSSVSFSDELTLTAQGPSLPALTSIQYIWKTEGTHSQVADIADDQQPLYRLKTKFQFSASAGGAETAPISVDLTIYDPDAQQPTPAMWSALDDDVSVLNQPIPGVDATYTLTANIPVDPISGEYLPVALDAMLVIETRNQFLNDGPGLNYFLQGRTEIEFSNSADLIGIIVRDETGAVRTDVDVASAAGVNYTLLVPEPGTLTLLGLVTAGLLASRPRRP